MADESTALEGVETEDATETEQEEVATETTDTEAEDADGEGGEQEVVEEIEFDFGGNKLSVPKGAIPEELAEQLDKFTKGTWSDYTRKSQDVAERAKRLETAEAAVQKLQTLNSETLDIYSRGLAVRQELEQLGKVDLSALWQSDPDRARQISDAISHKQAEFNSIVSRVNQKEAELSAAQQQETARRMDEGRQIVLKRVKDFNESEVMDYVVKEHGLTKEQAATWPLNPVTAIMAHKAMLFDRMQAKVATAARPKPAPAQPVKPMPGKGGAKPSLDLVRDADKMSVEEWARRRNAQLRKG